MKEENVIKIPQKLYSQPEYINISFLSFFLDAPLISTWLCYQINHCSLVSHKTCHNAQEAGRQCSYLLAHSHTLFSFLGWITALKFTYIYMHKTYTYCLMNNQKINVCVTFLESSLPITISSLCPSQLRAHPALPVLVCLSCCNKMTETGWLKRHTFISRSNGDLKSEIQVPAWLSSSKSPFLVLQTTASSLCPHMGEGKEGKLFGVSSCKPIIRAPHS